MQTLAYPSWRDPGGYLTKVVAAACPELLDRGKTDLGSLYDALAADIDEFEGLIDDAVPAPAAPAPAPAPPAPTSPTSPTGYSDDAEDFEDESDDDNEEAIGVGVQVEARFGGEEDWYPGSVKAVNADGTYQIAYDDGDEEDSVAPEYVRLRPASP